MSDDKQTLKNRAHTVVKLGALATILVSLAGCVIEPIGDPGPGPAYVAGPAVYAAPCCAYYGGGGYYGHWHGGGYGRWR